MVEGDIKFGGYRASGGAYSMVMDVDARLLVLEQGHIGWLWAPLGVGG